MVLRDIRRGWFGYVLFSLVFFGAALPAKALDAPAALVPAGLNPGDTFFIIFYSSGTTAGNLAAASNFNTFAGAQAALGPNTSQVTGWTALIGHDDTTNTSTSAFGGDTASPIYLVDGTLVANNRADLFDGTVVANISIDQSGNTSASGVWTGLTNTGTTDADALGTVGANCRRGANNSLNQAFSFDSQACGGSFPIYVLSPQLTVASPINAVPGSPMEW